jgi:glycosyltransferase involved in cell wall biosynthesis
VVDDHSVDETPSVVRNLQNTRIKYVRHENNRGASAARNTGIALAAGNYLAFLDDDDAWRNDKIEKQVAAMAHFDAVICAVAVHSDTGRKLYIQRYWKRVVDLQDLKRRNLFGTSTLLGKSDLFQQVRFDESLPSSQDWDIFIRLSQKCAVGYIDEPLALYSNAGHARITNQYRNMSLNELEKRMLAVYKHRDFLGSYWFNYNIARRLLAYIRVRDALPSWLIYTVKRCGVAPTLGALFDKVAGAWNRLHTC